MVTLFIRNLVFTILQPGIVAGLIPYLILGNKTSDIFVTQLLHPGLHSLGAIGFIIGFVIMLSCIRNFAIKGRGTLSPAYPTKRLVVAGLYKFSRNPMYVGVILMLIGEAIFFQSADLWVYSLFVFITFNIFILLIEEPRLKRDFGEEYTRYCKKVRRWI